MTLHEEQKIVQRAMNTTLSGLQEDPWLTHRVLANVKGERKVKKKISTAVILIAALICVSVAALAAGIINWNLGLDDHLQITDSVRETYKDTGLFHDPQLSVTQNGVTVTVDECIVDTQAAYLSFRVKGYTPPAGIQPDFDRVRLLLEESDDISLNINYAFFNGLITGPDGTAVYPDGSIPGDASNPSYANEDGELVYIISILTSDEDYTLIGKKLNISFGDLGFYTSKAGDIDVAVKGEWAFEFTLTGSSQRLDLTGLDLPIGETGAQLTEVHLSPIHLSMLMIVPQEQAILDECDDPSPYFRGVVLQDGTTYDFLGDGGFTGYLSESQDLFRQTWALNRVIDPEQVTALLFSAPDENSLIEVQFRH